MANTPTLSLRVPAERQGLIRAVVDRLKRADAAGDPAFGAMLKHLVEGEAPPGLEARLEAIECRLAELEVPHGGHFGERVRRAREASDVSRLLTAEATDLTEAALQEIEDTGRVKAEDRASLVSFLNLEEPASDVLTSPENRP